MPAMAAARSTAAAKQTNVLRLPFAPEPIIRAPAPVPLPDPRFAFSPGAWEQLIVAANLDRESRELSPVDQSWSTSSTSESDAESTGRSA